MSEKWYNSGDDWGEAQELWFEDDNFIKVILDKIDILDILDRCNVEYTRSQSGNFTHKMRCPFPDHLSGQERTASLYISERNNDFHCYGCNANGNIVTFIMLYYGVVYHKALKILNSFVNISDEDLDVDIAPREKIDPNFTVMPYIFKTGTLIREFLVSKNNDEKYEKWCIWASKRFKKLDYYCNTLDNSEWEVAKEYYDRVYKFLEKERA